MNQPGPCSPRDDVEPQPPSQPPWEWAGLAAVVLLAAGLLVWRLDQIGFGNSYYYAAAVRSMLVSGTNFFFG